MSSAHRVPITIEPATPGGLNELAELAQAIQGVSGTGDLSRRVRRLAERLQTARYHVAVLGDFKRGKSTLVNALVGQAVLPTGVVPLTTVATEVHVGGTKTEVVFRDGSRREIPAHEIAEYVTEQANPSNAKGVERTEVGVATEFGARGLVLVDTPGLSSVNESNTEEAHRALLDADGAILVLAADNPLSKSERDVLEQLATRGARVFVVINRCDALTPAELGEVRSFVRAQVGLVLGRPLQPFCVSARRTALERAQGATIDPIEFDELRTALIRFVDQDLASARRAAALAELERLGADLERMLDLEEAADAMDVATLDAQISQFTRSVDEGRRLLAEDVVLLGHDAEALLDDVGKELSDLAASAARRCERDLAAAVADLPRGQLDRGARDAIEGLVRSHFEPVRAQMSEQVEARWITLASRFTDRVQGHVDAVVASASDLFAAHLPQAEIPALRTQRGRFSYDFLYVEGQNAIIGHLLARLVPSAIARRRALRRGTQLLRQQFDKHAGRARYDTAERLRVAEAELTTEMAAEFEQTQASLLVACTEARSLRELGQAARRERADLRGRIRSCLSRIEDAMRGEQG